MHTRKDYMDGNVTHREYYGQLVTPDVIGVVEYGIGTTAILNSNDEAFNDIPLRRWDNLRGGIIKTVHKLPVGEIWSDCTVVCIAKEAARQIKELHA